MENYESLNKYDVQKPETPSGMSTASMVMGIISIVTSCCMFGFVFSSLGIIFALLSKTDEHYQKNAKIGIITSLIGFLLFILAIAAIVAVAGITAASKSFGGVSW